MNLFSFFYFFKKDTSFKKLSKELNAKYYFKRKGNIHLLNYEFESFNITLSKYAARSSVNTRIIVIYTPIKDIQLRIYQQTFLDKFASLLGMQDISIGSEEFDNEFVIEGNDENSIIQILDDDKIKNVLLELHEGSLEIKDISKTKSQKIFLMQYEICELISDTAVLKKMIELINLMLDKLLELRLIRKGRFSSSNYNDRDPSLEYLLDELDIEIFENVLDIV